jgi:hypothetical protein
MRAALFVLMLAADPFSGVWKLNLSKSKVPPPAPQSHLVHSEADARGIRLREDVINDQGEPIRITVNARFDGKDYEVAGTPFADAVAYRRVDSHTLKGTVKKAGKVVLLETVVVSRDGKILTGTYTTPDGKPAGVAVFEKQ